MTVWMILAKYGSIAAIGAGMAWYATDTYWTAAFSTAQYEHEHIIADMQAKTLAAVMAAQTDLDKANAKAATVARTLATERSKAATELHTTIGAVNDSDLRACLSSPLPRELLDRLPR